VREAESEGAYIAREHRDAPCTVLCEADSYRRGQRRRTRFRRIACEPPGRSQSSAAPGRDGL